MASSKRPARPPSHCAKKPRTFKETSQETKTAENDEATPRETDTAHDQQETPSLAHQEETARNPTAPSPLIEASRVATLYAQQNRRLRELYLERQRTRP
eukprot:Gregarina_sp_Pseudo_9__5682@NODE_808_length_2188_cov_33_417403_g759_i0_p3_GENE_NODE_808_length_2188_cov_33_417403_g759_i0NODE_808_length_2188_cov_33_417403_g759_i0_p3_ORF_typecomplete_len114_score29_80Pneumo_att_G/PF05539_11/0_4Mucin/PF01456_17/2_8Podoplanin/PF05808_11/4_5_NODE_808_length_2188_cov_33_417403_g759_i046342